jgi:ribosome-binding factor A
MTLRYSKPPSQRQLRVSELIRAEISNAFTRGILINYGLDSITLSVSEVRISPDLKIATAFLSTLIEKDKEILKPILSRLSLDIRKVISPKLNLRSAPEIRLTFDEAIASGSRVDDILYDLQQSSSGAKKQDS